MFLWYLGVVLVFQKLMIEQRFQMLKLFLNSVKTIGINFNRPTMKNLLTFTLFILILIPIPIKAAEIIKTSILHDEKELILNGIGRAKQLSDSFYLGALYLQQPFRSVDNITYINNYKRMQMRIVSRRVSSRRFSQYWKESISINNPRNVWEPQVADVLAFTDFFSKTLKKGDIVNIDFIPGLGTFVHINDVVMGRIRNPGFYNLLIMTWLGNRPPNEQFKLGVMGGNDADTAIQLQNQFKDLFPSAERIAESKSWLDENSDDNQVAAKKKTPNKKKTPKKTTAKKTVTKKPPVKKPTTKKTPTKKVVAEETKSAKKQAVDTGSAVNDVVVPPIPASDLKPVDVIVKKTSQEVKPAVVEETKEPEKLSSSDQLKLYTMRTEYERELRGNIRQFQKYPLRKMLRNRSYKKQMAKGPIESEGVLWIKIARDGSVISSKLEQSTGISILDQSAIEMVEKADPLPEMPLVLNGETFEFLVKLKFVSPILD